MRLRAQEERLVAAAHRYEESHRTKLTYEQVIERLKTEQLSWPEEVKALDTTLVQKEADYAWRAHVPRSRAARPGASSPAKAAPPPVRAPMAQGARKGSPASAVAMARARWLTRADGRRCSEQRWAENLVAEHRRGVLVLEAEGGPDRRRRRSDARLRRLRRFVLPSGRIAVIEGRLARRVIRMARPLMPSAGVRGR